MTKSQKYLQYRQPEGRLREVHPAMGANFVLRGVPRGVRAVFPANGAHLNFKLRRSTGGEDGREFQAQKFVFLVPGHLKKKRISIQFNLIQYEFICEKSSGISQQLAS